MNYDIPIEKHLEAEPQIAVVFVYLTHKLDTNNCRGGGTCIARIGSRDELALPYRHETNL